MVAQSSPKLLITEIQSPFFNVLICQWRLCRLPPSDFTSPTPFSDPRAGTRSRRLGLTLPQDSSLSHTEALSTRPILGGKRCRQFPALLSCPASCPTGQQPSCERTRGISCLVGMALALCWAAGRRPSLTCHPAVGTVSHGPRPERSQGGPVLVLGVKALPPLTWGHPL